MSKWLTRIILLAILVGGFLALRATVFATKPVPVQVVRPDRGRVEASLTNTRAGSVRARRRAQLSPEISGRVIELCFREGDRVEAGAVILRMDDTTQRAQLELARSTLAAAEARHAETCVLARRATREYERYQKAGDQLVSPDRLDELSSRVESAEAGCSTSLAQVEQSHAELRVYESQLEKTTLRAPFSGTLAELSVELGEFLTPSPPGVPLPPALDLIDLDSIYITAPMDEVDSARIRAGQAARVTLDPYPDRSFDAHVERVAPYVLDVEAQNRTVEIDVELEDGDFAKQLLPGTSADVEVILEVHEGSLRIPTRALLEGRRVLLLARGEIVSREIQVGLRNWDWTEVLSGLMESDRVITSLGDAAVRAGAKARVQVEEE